MKSKPTIVNLFLIYSPLHYLPAELVAGRFENGARNYLFVRVLDRLSRPLEPAVVGNFSARSVHASGR